MKVPDKKIMAEAAGCLQKPSVRYMHERTEASGGRLYHLLPALKAFEVACLLLRLVITGRLYKDCSKCQLIN